MARVLNYEMKKASREHPIEIGIEMPYGRALMVAAGHSGSKINDIAYMGYAVNDAANLAKYGNSREMSPLRLLLRPSTIASKNTTRDC